jgi:hypothetical protein
MVKQLVTEIRALKADRATTKDHVASDPSHPGNEFASQRRYGAPPPSNTQRGRGSQHGFQRGGRRRDQAPGDVVCYRCGERGHIRIGCRTNIDHLRKKDF